MNDIKSINLLPKWYKNKLQLETFIKKIAIITTVVFLLTAISAIYINYTVGAIESELRVITSNINDEKYELADRIYLELTTLNNLIRAETSRLEGAFSFSDNLNKIFSAMPGDIKVTGLSLSAQPAQILFRGEARQTESISEFIKNLSIMGFEDISLTRLSNTPGGLSAFTVEIEGIG